MENKNKNTDDTSIKEYLTKNLSEQGFDDTQISKIAEAFVNLQSEAKKELENKHEAELEKIYEGWGSKSKSNIVLAARAFKWLGMDNDDVFNLFDTISPSKIMDRFVQLGKLLSEDQGNTLVHKNVSSMDSNQAKKERASLMLDENFLKAITNRNHPAHEGAMDKLNKLNEIISN